MQVEMYADVIFFINWIMDFFLLWLAGRLSGKKCKIFRLLLGGGMCAFLYCCILFLSVVHTVLSSIFVPIFLIAVGVEIAFFPRRFKEFMKLMLLSYVSSFVVGGVGMALWYTTNMTDLMGNVAMSASRHFSWKILLAATGTVFVCVKLGSGWVRSHVAQRRSYCTLALHLEDKSIQVTALVDTGNRLCDPISGYPVIIVEFDKVLPLLPEGSKNIFIEGLSLPSLLQELEHSKLRNRFRMIPFHSLGTTCGMLLGFYPDAAEIIVEEKEKRSEKVIVGIYQSQLSSHNEYGALIGPDLLCGF